MIKLQHIRKTYLKENQLIHTVNDVSINISKGEIFGIIGFSGAGKSTLVRCINLLERPDPGSRVIVNGVDLTALSGRQLRAARSEIGMIFQHFNLMPSRTVLDNVIFPLKYRGISKEEQIATAKKLLELVDLKDRTSSYPSELSGGQKQRVAIARALAVNPKVLLCDEATSALDPQTTQEILDLLKSLNKKLGLTIVIITHEMAVVKDICSKVAILERGNLVEQGNIFEVFSNPKHSTTRRFVAAASNLSKVDQILKLHPEVINLAKGQLLVRLSYLDRGVSEPLISSISQKFSLVMNILFADIELINGAPIGGTVGILDGTQENIYAAIDYLRKKHVNVETLKNA